MEIPSPEISNYFFLSDMHLQPEQELKQKKVLDFLESIGGSSLIVVVGDLFDYWVPASCSRYKYFLNRLMHISDQKNIYFIKGNRDFFIRKQSVKFGLIDLGYSAIFNVKGLKMFVSHGDIQFSNDSIHKIYSGIIRSRCVSFISEFVPKTLIDKIGSGLRKHSKGRYNLKVEPPFESYFRYLTNYDVIISGHFHLNKICRYNYKGQEKIVVFLGEQTDESLQYLQVDAANVKPIFELKEFR